MASTCTATCTAIFRSNQMIHQKIVEASRNATLKGAYANFAGRIRGCANSANFAASASAGVKRCANTRRSWMPAAPRRPELSDILFKHLRNKRDAAVEHLKTGGMAATELA